MNGNVLRCVAVFVAGGLLLAGSASAQFTGQVKVSNAIEDSGFPGFPPAGVSAARCGSNVVVGFGDTEAGILVNTAGFAVSKDGGNTFSDLGVLADPFLQFGGGSNPVIACSSSSTFYYATRGFKDASVVGCEVDCTDISVSSSSDGGRTWNPAVVASIASFDIYELQSPSLAIDPSNPQRLYAAYINHNFAGPNDFAGCSGGDEYILEVVTYADGGKTWNGRMFPPARGTPSTQPDHTCAADGFDAEHTGMLVSPTVVVSPSGAAYVAYEFVAVSINGAPPPPNEIRFTQTLDHGASFSTPVTVSRGAIDNAAPEIAVDRTNSPHRGQIFLTWSGEPAGTYTSVLESDSLNAGLSFSFPRPINGTPGAGLGRFQANPVIAVDNDGQVQICYYNTPTNTPTSTSVYSYNCATSFNHAATWQLQRVANSAPVGYDAVTSDFLTHHDGFFNAFELQTNGTRRVVGQFSDIN